ncbi:MAG: DUF1640 domain-containing protein [Magnetococcales bacterium]|nr:DUF1640 domain-containing protein [Magnetococcales bacterium]MBF0419328.1 DUF1640 domain-containing protein [Magnetococcales bacterium]
MGNTIVFDTLEFTEQLKASGVPDDQAKGHAKAMAHVLEQIEEARLKELATKRDLKELELRMVIKMGGMILAGIGILFGLMRAWPLPVQFVPVPGQEIHQTVPLIPPKK